MEKLTSEHRSKIERETEWARREEKEGEGKRGWSEREREGVIPCYNVFLSRVALPNYKPVFCSVETLLILMTPR